MTTAIDVYVARLSWGLLLACGLFLFTLWARGDLPALPLSAVVEAQRARTCARLHQALDRTGLDATMYAACR